MTRHFISILRKNGGNYPLRLKKRGWKQEEGKESNIEYTGKEEQEEKEEKMRQKKGKVRLSRTIKL